MIGNMSTRMMQPRMALLNLIVVTDKIRTRMAPSILKQFLCLFFIGTLFLSANCVSAVAATSAPSSSLPDAPVPQNTAAGPVSSAPSKPPQPYAKFYWRTIPPEYRAKADSNRQIEICWPGDDQSVRPSSGADLGQLGSFRQLQPSIWHGRRSIWGTLWRGGCAADQLSAVCRWVAANRFP